MLCTFGSYAPTLTRDGVYIRFAGLMYYAATGERADLERHCKQHFDALKGGRCRTVHNRRGPLPKRELIAVTLEKQRQLDDIIEEKLAANPVDF